MTAHALLFLLSAAVIWFLSGLLIDATDSVARRYRRPGFAVAFLVLGLLTSIGEFSVATNATFEDIPQVSAGNLIGASVVIFLLIIPLLATLGDGIAMTKAILPKNLLLLLGVVILPAVLAFDGEISKSEGVIMILLYIVLLYRIQKNRPVEEMVKEAILRTEEKLLHTRYATTTDIGKIAIGAILIFIAGNLLVEESVYFARFLSIPVSFVGLLLLSLGTNIPELVIAIRCIFGRHKDIAFGDYMGSAAGNTLIFGFLPLANGAFTLEQSEVAITFGIFVLGLILFFFFSRSKNDLSRREGICLLILYALFLLTQIGNAVRLHEQSSLQADIGEVRRRNYE